MLVLMMGCDCAGACATAPGDGVSAANVAARTLHVAKQYIQHRKVREQRQVEESMDAEAMQTPDEDEYLDRQPVTLSSSHSDSAFDSAFISGNAHVNGNGAHANGKHTNGQAVNGTHVNGTAVKGGVR